MFIRVIYKITLILMLFTEFVRSQEVLTTLNIGVMAFRSVAENQKIWKPLERELEKLAPQYEFNITSYHQKDLTEMVAGNKLHFVITQSMHYLLMEYKYSISNIATLVTKDILTNHRFANYGGVIAVLKDRDNINSLDDIVGKKIGATHPTGLAAVYMQRCTFDNWGIDIEKDAEIIYTGQPMDRVFEAMKSGEVDVGFFRTGYLDEMAYREKINLNEIKIINEQSRDSYPYLRSTPLYPNWAVAYTTAVDSEVVKDVATALYQVRNNNDFDYCEFTIPLSYKETRKLMQRFQIPPYETSVTLSTIWKEYSIFILGLMAILISVLTMLFHLKRLTDNLQAEQEFISTIVDMANAVISVIGADGTMRRLNQYGQKFTGYSQDEVSSQPYFWSRFLNEDIKDSVHEIIDKANSGEMVKYYRNSWISKSGEERMFEWSNQMINKKDGTLDYIFSIGIDITDKIEAQQRVTEQKEQFELLVKKLPIPIAVSDNSGNITLVNDTFIKTLGYINSDIPTVEKWFGFAYPDPQYREYVVDIWTRHLSEDPVYIQGDEYRVIGKDGSSHTMEISGLKIDSGLVVAFVDFTERKNIEVALEREKEKFKHLLEFASDGIHILDIDGNVIQCSLSFAQMLGYSIEEALKLNVRDWEVNIQQDKLKSKIADLMENPNKFESEHRRKDGTTFNVQINAKGINLGDKRYLYASSRDISEQKIAQKMLEQQKEEWETIFISSKDPIAVLDLESNFIRVNPAYTELIGFTADELLETSCIGLSIDEDVERAKKAVADVIEIGFVKNFEKSCYTKSGGIVTINMSLALMPDREHILITTKDVTEEKLLRNQLIKEKQRAEESSKKFSSLFNHSPDAYLITDLSNGVILDCNDATERMLRGSRSEIVGLTPDKLSPKYQPDGKLSEDYVRENIEQVYKFGFHNFDHLHHRLNGEEFWANVTISIVQFDGRDALFVAWRDISDKKALEESLKLAEESANRANRAKSEFLANMSHEIRTPLNGIIGLTDIVLNSELTPIQRDYLHKSQHSSHALLNVINDILDYSKIEAGKLDIVPAEFKLDKTLHTISDLFSFKVSEKGLEFNFTIEPTLPNRLVGDSLRLTQILNNLMGNAIKFTSDGFINLDLQIDSQSDEDITIQFSVKDSGIGISVENQKKLFRPFEQGDSSTTKKFGGTGLGLMISKQLVELMGGEIWVESEEGVGTAFSFKLPFQYSKDNREYGSSIFKNRDILVADDSHIDREYLENILSSWGAKTYMASDGEEAIQLLKREKFDYVLLDWQMPKLDGVEVLKRLKQLNIDQSNVLMISAYRKNDILAVAEKEELSIDAVLEKPYTPSSLYNAIFNQKMHSEDESLSQSELHLSTQKNALMVEDNETNQLVGSIMLKEYGFNVSIANNGVEAVEIAKKESFDIIFMDLQMPIMDGFDATKEIRKFNQTIPIIALSAAVMQQDKVLTRDAGMNDHLAKPINRVELEKVIANYFEVQQVATKEAEEFNEITIDGIDLKQMHRNLSLDQQSLYLLYKNFYNGYIGEVEKIESLTSDEFKKFVHKLKGASGNLQINDLHNLCVEIENSNYTDDSQVELKRGLNRVCQNIENEIIPLIEELDSSSETPLAETLHILNNTIDKLENMEYIAGNEIDNLTTSLKGRVADEQIETIESLFSKGDDDSLQEFLEHLQKDLK